MSTDKRCGRLGDHLSHHWYGDRTWNELLGRWHKPVYWCSGHVVIEGGHR